jgi:uroporphyrinogen-III decarboxylase
MFEGVERLAQEIGHNVFLEVGCNSSFRFALGFLGLQQGLVFMIDEPDTFRYLTERVMEHELEYLRVMASLGVHSAWINDIWVDLISESHYREFVMPIAAAFIQEARELGLRSHYYPCGKAAHLIPVVNELAPDALHLEEFAQVDICEIRNQLDRRIVLYGNIPAMDILQNGSIAAIEDEARRQMDACLTEGPFVLALGTEVTKYTPPEHVDALIGAARAYRSA